MPVLPPPPQSSGSASGEQLVSIADVVKRTQALLDDQTGSWADQNYLMPYINQAWDELAMKLTGLGLSYEEIVTVLPDVVALTSDLSSYQALGQPLASMLTPKFLEWRLTTELDIYYQEIPLLSRLPDVDAATQGHLGYEWRGGIIRLTPSAVDTTVRVRYNAISLNFVDANDGVIHGCVHILAYKAAEIVCSPVVRNNAPGMAWAKQHGDDALDEFEVLCVKLQQRSVQRFGRISGRSRFTSKRQYIARSS